MRKSEIPRDLTQLECWKEARSLVGLLYSLTMRESFAHDEVLMQLLRRLGISMMGRISDGYHQQDKTRFLACLEDAKGALGEVISALYVAHDQDYLNHDDLNDTLGRAYTVGIHINSQIKAIQKG